MTFHRTPAIRVILKAPRMEKRFTAGDEFHRIADAFVKAAETYGGDPIAVNLIKEYSIMAKILVIDTEAKKVHSTVGSKKKADSILAEAGEGHHLVIAANKDEFDALHEDVRSHIAKTNANVATLPHEEQLERAYEVATTKVEAVNQPKPSTSKGVKVLIRQLFAVEGARHSIEDVMHLTEGSKSSVTTAISDLRSPKYCKPGEPLRLTRLPDGNYALVSKEYAAEVKANFAAAKAKDAAEEKAAAKAEKAAAKAGTEEAA